MRTFAIAIFLAYLSRSAAHGGELPKVDAAAKLKDSKEVRVYAIIDGEVDVKSSSIKRIELGSTSAIVTFLNKNRKALKPRFAVRLVNAYGVEVLRCHQR